MMEHAALVRITPEAMTRLLGLPDGNRVLRFQIAPYGVEVFVGGEAMPTVEGGEPSLIDCSELDELLRPQRNVTWRELAAVAPVYEDHPAAAEERDAEKEDQAPSS